MTDKQTQARTLFLQTDLGKTEIAEMLGIPRRTLHHWITANNWQIQKQAAACMPALLAENCYHIILRLQEHLMSDDRANTPITRQEADTLHKLILTVGKMNSRATLNESMEMMQGFMESVNVVAPAMSPHIMPLVDNYLATRSSVTPQQLRSKQMDASYPPATNEPEAALDEQVIRAWQTEGNMPEQEFKPVTVSERLYKAHKPRTKSPSDYNDMLADFRRQDENLKHLFPINTRHPQAA